jgi:site-specific recombinase XerD
MALIKKCRSCRAKVPLDATACPACRYTGLSFMVDYWPEGRSGGRKYKTLAEQVDTVEEAREWEKIITGAARTERNGRKQSAVVTKSSVADLFPEYLKWFKLHREATTHREVTSTYNHAIDRILGKVRVLDINADHARLYQSTRKLDMIKRDGVIRPVSNRTVNKELDYFRGFLTWCRKVNGMAVSSIEIDKLPCTRPLPIILSPAEVMRILRAAEPAYRVFFICLYTLGLRLSEVRFMPWSGVDFSNRVIRVRQKGGTDKVLPMNDWVRMELKAWRRRQLRALAKEKDESRRKMNELVFPSWITGGAFNNVRKPLARACKAAGIEKRVTAHLLRHSIATHFMGKGVNLRTIQQYLGHADISMTEWYTHVTVDIMRDAADGVFKAGIYKKRRNIRAVSIRHNETN